MGEYHHTLDDKSRVIIPSKFRYELGEKFIITRGLEKCLFVYSMDEWNNIIEKLKQLAAKGKLDKVYDFIDNFIQCDEKIIVFAKHSEIYNNIIKRYSGISVHVVGGMTSKQKDDAVTRFQTDDNIKKKFTAARINALLAVNSAFDRKKDSIPHFTYLSNKKRIEE